MALTINVTDATVQEDARVYRRDDISETGVHTEKWYCSIVFLYVNAQGKTLRFDRERQLTAGQTTTVKNFLNAQKTAVLAEEGIT